MASFFDDESSDDDDVILAQFMNTALKCPTDEGAKATGNSNNATGHKYSVKFRLGEELDVVWETDWRGKIVRVKQFKLIDSQPGPASEDGRIKAGHTLLEIDGKSVPEDFQETLLHIKSLTRADGDNATRSYTMRFFSPDKAPVTQSERMLGSVMKEIHLHKIALYRAQAEGLTKGFIERYRGDHMVTFHLHRESDNKFICGVSCKKNMRGDFIFHTLADMTWDAKLSSIPTDPSAATYLGKMVKSFSGTSFTLHDYRVTNPNDANAPRHQLATMVYKTNVTGGDPNAFTTIMPRYDEEYLEEEQKQTLIDRHKLLKKKRGSLEQTMLDKLRRKKDLAYGSIEQQEEAELIVLQTQKPVFCEELQAFTLDFDGRVKMPCKRNFILSVDPDNQRLVDEFGEGTTLLRHGKVNEDRYCLDYRYPLSPVQALAVAVTSFAEKLLVT